MRINVITNLNFEMLQYKSVFIGSLIFLIIGLSMGFLGFPIILTNRLKSEFALEPGSEFRQFWEKAAIPINFKIYVFNVTNPTEVQNGEKVVFEEVGPFVFQ